MKKIIFALLFITMAFSQFDNTIAGWYNEHYYVPEGSVYSEGIVVADESSLGSESLAETDFATHANWDVTNDIVDSGGNAAYTWSANQTSTLTQIQANLATAGVGDRWYVFTYTVAVTTAFDGDGAVTITTGFASSAVSLSLVAGTHTVYFKSKITPVDFVISVVSGSDTEGTFTIDDVTLKEIQGGNVEAYGLFTGGGSTGLKIDSDGNARLPKAIFLDEKASQETIAAGEGQYWVKDTAPTTPMFTDDDGDDHRIATDGGYFHVDTSSVNDAWGFEDATISGYDDGMIIYVKIAVVNTDGATLQINALGAKAVHKQHNVALATGDVEVGQILHLVYDNTDFQMLSQLAQ